MFVQVVRGPVIDGAATLARLDHWLEHLAPTAEGWLGTTAGLTRDRELVAFVRFATAADARRSSDRIEQGQWWAESMLLFAGDVSFDNFDDVTVFGDGGSDAAGTVEVLRGRVRPGSGGPTWLSDWPSERWTRAGRVDSSVASSAPTTTAASPRPATSAAR